MRFRRSILPLAIAVALSLASPARRAEADVKREEVERAIRDGVRFLKANQLADGSWKDLEGATARTGMTSLVSLALLTAGEPPESPSVARALGYLRNFDADQLDSVYAVALQTMVFAAAKPKDDIVRISANAAWLESAQIKPGDGVPWPGSWAYRRARTSQGDNSNSQYALLGLNAAAEAGVKVKPEVWELSRKYWETHLQPRGGWNYVPTSDNPTTGSMTCAGISSLIISGTRRVRSAEVLVGEERVDNCGATETNPALQGAIDWMARNFQVGSNIGFGQQWKYYYLYGLERAGRLSGLRYFGRHDWYLKGAEELVHDQDKFQGFWQGHGNERDRVLSTAFAILFLAKGRSPVLVNKLRHGPGSDWNNDLDDVRNLCGLVSKDWNTLMTWQVVDPAEASVEDLMQAPIAFINGHEAPVLSAEAKKKLREFVDQGGCIVGEACCGRTEFDQGFRALMKDLFPEPDYDLHPLAEDHAVWRSRWDLTPDVHPLWGIEHGCRTVVIYSPDDLSCYWNQMDNVPSNPRVVKSQRVGQNIIDYFTGREIPADKLSTPEIKNFKPERARRGALRIAKLKHAGEWNIAPLAVANLAATLRDKLKFDVVVNQKELLPTDPALKQHPFLYLHGRAAMSFNEEERKALLTHLDPGGGTLFADAACGSASFDGSFRKLMAELLPKHPLEAIPKTDELYTKAIAYDLKDVQYTKASGGARDLPQLEGIKIDGRWAVIYSKLDIGCALERHQAADCKGYVYESAMRIACNVVIYSTLP